MSPFTLPDSVLEQLMQDDSPFGDATSWGLGIGEEPGRIIFRAKHAQTVCCTEEAARMAVLRGLSVDGSIEASGTTVEPGRVLLCLTGRAVDLQSVWKPAQTLMEYSAGIASATLDLVAAARRGNPHIVIACSRKHMPGAKAICVKAILVGGAVPHRLGLSESLVILAQHRTFLRGETLDKTIDRLHRDWPERRVVIEVKGEADAIACINAGADVIQLDRCSPQVIEKVAQYAEGRPVKIAAIGGISISNAETYARAGAHILITSAQYSAKPKDVAVILEPN